MSGRRGILFPMVQAIREFVTVGPNGTVKVQAPALREGSRAEVIVLLEPVADARSDDRLAALDALQRSVKLDESRAKEWASSNTVERKAASRL
jgi:hypothetical protein